MNFYINQTIQIQTLKVDGISNSSVLQIGSAGKIQALSNLYNTGGFEQPAPEIVQPAGAAGPPPLPTSVIPLAPPTG